jgi:predicted DNA-binding ribbon-helix-helix protein
LAEVVVSLPPCERPETDAAAVEMAEGENLTMGKFISKPHDEAIESNREIPNFASMLRTTCTLYLRGRQLREAVNGIAREAPKQCAVPGRRTALRNI